HTCGRPRLDRNIYIEEGSEESGIGTIMIEGKDLSYADTYWLAERALRERFKEGVLWAGDRGYFDEDGFLVMSQSTTEILKVAARSVSAQHIELELRKADQTPKLVVVGVPHKRYGEVAACIYEQTGNPDLEKLLADRARLRLRSDEVPRHFIPR